MNLLRRRSDPAELSEARLTVASTMADLLLTAVWYSIENNTRKYDTLNWWEQKLHQQFHEGRLHREMTNANKAFGHGIGAEKSLSIEQMAVLELSFKGH